MRIFICIELSEEIKKEIERIVNKIKNSGLIRAKFVEPENLHLTLKFLGEIGEKEAENVKEALSSIKIKRVNVRLDKIGVFSPNYIRVLWINLEGELRKLYEEVEKALGDLFPKEKREWSSHVTLARIKSVKDRKDFLEKIKKIRVEPVEFLIEKVKLKKSTLTEKGPIYKDLFEVRLG